MNNKPSKVLMVRPARFGYNKETAATNSFQKNDKLLSAKEIQAAALEEFDNFVELLKVNGIEIEVLNDTANPITPDSIFPNNLISFHVIENFTVPTPDNLPVAINLSDLTFAKVNITILYPMMAKNRRKERKKAIVKVFRETKLAFDLTTNEDNGNFLEGTGSLVFDYDNFKVYASISPRTNKELAEVICDQLNQTLITFHSEDANGQEIYHTNVMMSIGKGFAVVCTECIKDKEELYSVMSSLINSNHEIITIDYNQLNSFAGNIYQLFNDKKESIIVMSEQAYKSFSVEQINKLEKHGKIIHTPLYTIEKYGGGSARCMIADVRH